MDGFQFQRMQQEIADQAAQIATILQENQALQQHLRNVSDRLTVAEQVSTAQAVHAADTGVRGDTKGGLYDKRLYEPEKLDKAANFKEWAEDFFEFVEMCDTEVSSLLRVAVGEKDVISESGGSLVLRTKSKALHRMLKRSVSLLEARRIIVLSPGKIHMSLGDSSTPGSTPRTTTLPGRSCASASTGSRGNALSSRTCPSRSKRGRSSRTTTR